MFLGNVCAYLDRLPKLVLTIEFLLSIACFAQFQFVQLPSNPGDSGQLRDITGIEVNPRVPVRSWWPYGLAIAMTLMTVLFLAGWKWWRRPSNVGGAEPGAWALLELQRIDSMNLLDSCQIEKYHTLCSQVIRQYLERRFQARSSRQTTPEFLQAMGHSTLLISTHQKLLEEFLDRCDLAKFGQVRFPKEECQKLGQSARAFVEQTARDLGNRPPS
jgi:hypothetical protein